MVLHLDEAARRFAIPTEHIIIANMNCDYHDITKWFNEFTSWCGEQGVQAELLNHWTDESGNHASYYIPDETHRLWAKLKWE
jgi:hypothetical protein